MLLFEYFFFQCLFSDTGIVPQNYSTGLTGPPEDNHFGFGGIDRGFPFTKI